MDAELIKQISKLPAAAGRKKALAFSSVLADDLRQLEKKTKLQMKPLQEKSQKFEKVRQLVAEQAKILAHASKRNDEIEEAILQLLGLAGSKRKDDD
jgi:hypothetical protein